MSHSLNLLIVAFEPTTPSSHPMQTRIELDKEAHARAQSGRGTAHSLPTKNNELKGMLYRSNLGEIEKELVLIDLRFLGRCRLVLSLAL